jgi:hypothetical protein
MGIIQPHAQSHSGCSLGKLANPIHLSHEFAVNDARYMKAGSKQIHFLGFLVIKQRKANGLLKYVEMKGNILR